ncbi:hypothetical protein F66182_1783 [Fusarium sp. NRRL 66182]|nr:hypothetical protein F66182_1783 [Fusarium sp. NRRL 66182]
MSSTIITRLSTSASQAARRHISTASPMPSALASKGAHSTTRSTTWRWSSLSPQARRYAIAGLTVFAGADLYVHYTYWPQIQAWFRGGVKGGN